MNETVYSYLLIKVKDPNDHTSIKEIASKFDAATSESVSTHIVYQERNDMTTTFELLNTIFSATIAIMMFLCFFSLTSATTANLFD